MWEAFKRVWKELPAGFRVPVIIGTVILVGAFVAMIGTPVVSDLLAPRALSIKSIALATVGAKTGLDLTLWNESEVAQPITSLDLELTVKNVPPSGGLGMLHVYGARGTMAVSTEGKGPISGNQRPLGPNQTGLSSAYPFAGSMLITPDGKWTLAVTAPLREQAGPGESLSLGAVLPETITITGAGQGLQVQPWMKDYTSGDPPGEFHLVVFLRKFGQAEVHIMLRYANQKVAGYRSALQFSAPGGVGTR